MAVPVTIRWIADPELSFAQAAYVVATGAYCVDRKTESLLASAVAEINTRLISSEIEAGAFWKRYRSEVARDRRGPDACSDALLAAGCSELQLDQIVKAISSRLSEGRIEFRKRFPKLTEQLELRGRPLQDRWQTAGPGLLRDVQRQVWGDRSPDRWWTPRTEARLIQPMRGGDGGIAESAARFWIEAMLTDADPAVPEVLRVAWLVTRLAIAAHLPAADPPLVRSWGLAAVPLVLTAAGELSLLAGDSLPVKSAIERWQLGDAEIAERVEFWWSEQRSNRAPLPIAVKELARLLEAGSRDDD